MTAQTRYCTSFTWTVNTKTGRRLNISESTSFEYTILKKYGGDFVADGMTLGIRVWKVDIAGTETEITSGTPVAQYTRNTETFGANGTGTWACPLTNLASTDAILIRIYGRFSTDVWQQIGLTFFWITEQLSAQSLDAVTWTVTYHHAFFYDDPISTNIELHWGVSTNETKIANFTFTPAPSAGAVLASDSLIWVG